MVSQVSELDEIRRRRHRLILGSAGSGSAGCTDARRNPSSVRPSLANFFRRPRPLSLTQELEVVTGGSTIGRRLWPPRFTSTPRRNQAACRDPLGRAANRSRRDRPSRLRILGVSTGPQNERWAVCVARTCGDFERGGFLMSGTAFGSVRAGSQMQCALIGRPSRSPTAGAIAPASRHHHNRH